MAATSDSEAVVVNDNDSSEEESGEGEAEEASSSSTVRVVYCGVCSMPVEYCEWSGTYDACRAWLESYVYLRFSSRFFLFFLT